MEYSIKSERKKLISTQEYIPKEVLILSEDKPFKFMKPEAIQFINNDEEKVALIGN